MSDKITKKLSMSQEVFVNELLKGKSKSEAYKIAYPNTRCNATSLTVCAQKLFKAPHVQAYYQKLFKEFQEREQTKTGWTREQAIEALRVVIDTNRRDMMRIEQAANDELEYIQSLIDKETNPKEIRMLIEKMLHKRQRTIANRTNNDGIISAVAELNKMQGFNEQTINLNGAVVFEGEEEIPE